MPWNCNERRLPLAFLTVAETMPLARVAVSESSLKSTGGFRSAARACAATTPASNHPVKRTNPLTFPFMTVPFISQRLKATPPYSLITVVPLSRRIKCRISKTLSVARTCGTGRPLCTNDLVDRGGLAANHVEHLLLHVVQEQFGRMMHRAAVVAGGRFDQGAKLLQHVVGRFDQDRPVAEQAMAASRRAAVDIARHGEHVAALLHGMPGRDQRAGAFGRLDDDHPQRHAADDAVSLGEGAGQRATSAAAAR